MTRIRDFAEAILDEPDEPAHRAALLDWLGEQEGGEDGTLCLALRHHLERNFRLREDARTLQPAKVPDYGVRSWEHARRKVIGDDFSDGVRRWWCVLSVWMPLRSGTRLWHLLTDDLRRHITVAELYLCGLVEQNMLDGSHAVAALERNKIGARISMGLPSPDGSLAYARTAMTVGVLRGVMVAGHEFAVDAGGTAGGLSYLARKAGGRRDNDWLCRLAHLIRATRGGNDGNAR